jgi:hypothetical protein
MAQDHSGVLNLEMSAKKALSTDALQTTEEKWASVVFLCPKSFPSKKK